MKDWGGGWHPAPSKDWIAGTLGTWGKRLGTAAQHRDQVPHREALWKFLQDSFLPSTQAGAVFSKQGVKVRV